MPARPRAGAGQPTASPGQSDHDSEHMMLDAAIVRATSTAPGREETANRRPADPVADRPAKSTPVARTQRTCDCALYREGNLMARVSGKLEPFRAIATPRHPRGPAGADVRFTTYELSPIGQPCERPVEGAYGWRMDGVWTRLLLTVQLMLAMGPVPMGYAPQSIDVNS